jgi:hypothetical protein
MQSTSVEACEPCRTTNAVGIDISARSEAEEAALVVSLSRELEDTEKELPGIGLTDEEKDELDRQLQSAGQESNAGNLSKEQEALVKKMNVMAAKGLARVQQRVDGRQEAAERLAYLPGDQAVRGKVHFLVAEQETGDANPIGPIMVDGLPSSRNLTMQLALLEAAWRDPTVVPTGTMQTALREAREPVRSGMVIEEPLVFAGSDEQRKAAIKECQNEIDELIATMPLRTGEVREKTIAFMRTRPVPNEFSVVAPK